MSIADELRDYADEIRPDIDCDMYFWLQDCADRIECGETHLAERHLPWDDDDEYWLYCDECGYWLYMRKSFSRPRYCSHCGRKAVEEGAISGKDELLDKAIVEAKEAEDWQLVEWLRAARGSESAARWYSGKLRDANRVKRKLLNENAKLREFIDLKEACWKYVGWCGECPYGGVDDEHDDCSCTVREKVNSLASELGIEV